MHALHDQPGVRVPEVLFADPGIPPGIPPLVAMSWIDGQCIEPVLVAERDETKFAEVKRRALDLAAVLAAIHRGDPAGMGLGEEPIVTLAGEIDRWTRAFATVPSDLQHGYQRCAAMLHSTIPNPLAPVVTHGDYRLGNALTVDDRVTAIIDWEIWSLGDPRIDVAWMTFFTDEARHPGAAENSNTGMPTPAQLCEAYLSAGGAPLVDLPWFDALTRYKEAAATALLIKRGRREGELAPVLQRMRPSLPSLLDEACDLVRWRRRT